MAMDLEGNIVDPFGGQKELETMWLKPTSKAFVEDPLRFVRALRFVACKGFEFHPELERLMDTADLSSLPVERIWQELFKSMSGDHAERFWDLLTLFNIHPDLFSLIHRMVDVPAGPKEFHGSDSVFDHSHEVLRSVMTITNDPIVRLAAFLHDLGKILTPEDKWPAHHNHDVDGFNVVDNFLASLKAPMAVHKVCRTVAKHHMRFTRWEQMRASKKLAFVKEVTENKAFAALFMVCLFDWGPEAHKVKGEMVVVDAINRMSISELRLTVEDFDNRPGDVIAHMILDRRISETKRRL
jgi:tRNA nucleotidyltransferase (CCA-adding enzyme)